MNVKAEFHDSYMVHECESRISSHRILHNI